MAVIEAFAHSALLLARSQLLAFGGLLHHRLGTKPQALAIHRTLNADLAQMIGLAYAALQRVCTSYAEADLLPPPLEPPLPFLAGVALAPAEAEEAAPAAAAAAAAAAAPAVAGDAALDLQAPGAAGKTPSSKRCFLLNKWSFAKTGSGQAYGNLIFNEKRRAFSAGVPVPAIMAEPEPEPEPEDEDEWL